MLPHLVLVIMFELHHLISLQLLKRLHFMDLIKSYFLRYFLVFLDDVVFDLILQLRKHLLLKISLLPRRFHFLQIALHDELIQQLSLFSILEHSELPRQLGLLLAIFVFLHPLGPFLILVLHFDHLRRLPPGLFDFLEHFCLFVVEHEDPVRQQRRIKLHLLLLPVQIQHTIILPCRRQITPDGRLVHPGSTPVIRTDI